MRDERMTQQRASTTSGWRRAVALVLGATPIVATALTANAWLPDLPAALPRQFTGDEVISTTPVWIPLAVAGVASALLLIGSVLAVAGPMRWRDDVASLLGVLGVFAFGATWVWVILGAAALRDAAVRGEGLLIVPVAALGLVGWLLLRDWRRAAG